METDRGEEREFMLAVLDAAKKHGLREDADIMAALVRRALHGRDTGRWTNASSFFDGVRASAPSFFVDAVTATTPLDERPEPTSKAPGDVITRTVKGVLYASREDMRDAQKYRIAKARAEKLGIPLPIDPAGEPPGNEPMRPFGPT